MTSLRLAALLLALQLFLFGSFWSQTQKQLRLSLLFLDQVDSPQTSKTHQAGSVPLSEEKSRETVASNEFAAVHETTKTLVRTTDSLPVEQECASRYPGCHLQQIDPWGVPVLFLSQGRSGSQSLWGILSLLLSKDGMGVHEDVGLSSKAIAEFMRQRQDYGKCWLVQEFCHSQTQNMAIYHKEKKLSAIYGTKWKPYMPAFNMSAARAALSWVANDAPYVKVIYNERNPLDVYISGKKHSQGHVSAHCVKGATKCVQDHHNVKTRLDPKKLINGLRSVVKTNENARSILKELGVNYLQVSYEKLFHGTDASEWQRMVDYIGVKPLVDPITMESVNNVTVIVATSDSNRSNHVSNFEEVVETLRGTKYEKYLRY